MAENILFLCAHNDDQVIGAGGTIAKYAKEGMDVTTVIFSYGEKSHPLLKPEHIINRRKKEGEACDKILGGKEIIFFDVKEGQFTKDYEDKNLEKELITLIKKLKPKKIFCHGNDDLHPDHQAVYKISKNLIETLNFKGDVYTFDVWTPINFKERNEPKMVVDVSKTFKTKIKAFKAHKSQKFTIITLLWSVYLKAFLNGLNNNCRFAEVFHKLK